MLLVLLWPMWEWYDRWMHVIDNQHYQWYQDCNTNQILISSGYVEVRKSLYIYSSYWLGNTTLNCINTRKKPPNHEGFLHDIETQMIYKTKFTIKFPTPRCMKGMWNPQYRYPNGIKEWRYQTNTNYDIPRTMFEVHEPPGINLLQHLDMYSPHLANGWIMEDHHPTPHSDIHPSVAVNLLTVSSKRFIYPTRKLCSGVYHSWR